MLIIRGVNVYPSQIEVELLKVAELAPHYQLEVIQQGSTKGLVVQVETQTEASDELAGELAARAIRHIKQNIGITVELDVGSPGTVERSLGKAQRVIDTTA